MVLKEAKKAWLATESIDSPTISLFAGGTVHFNDVTGNLVKKNTAKTSLIFQSTK